MCSQKKVAVYCITKKGISIGVKLKKLFSESCDLFVSEKLYSNHCKNEGAKKLVFPMKTFVQNIFSDYDSHIFVVSVGAVIRMIAPVIRDKKIDPAVLSIDEAGKFVISLLSGHRGGANALTEKVANKLGSTPIITTASDVSETISADIIGKDLDWKLDDSTLNVTNVCADVVNERKVLVAQETGEKDVWNQYKNISNNISFKYEQLECLNNDYVKNFSSGIIISDRVELEKNNAKLVKKSIIYRPKSLVVGLGCDRDTPTYAVEKAIRLVFERWKLSFQSIKIISSIDLKKDEIAFCELAEKFKWKFLTYPACELDKVVNIENPSDVVKRCVGTKSVGEAASLLASNSERLLIPKVKYKDEKSSKNVTVSVSRIVF